jgi:effector-binding domain-containing protein
MTIEVEVKDVADVLVASVTRRVSLATVGKEIREGFATLARAVERIGFGEGMPGVVYHDIAEEWRDGTIEIFVPIAAPFEPPEDVSVTTLAGGTVAVVIHRGPYDECTPAYDALRAWIRDHGRQIAGPPTELYLNDPSEVGMENALTEIRFPIR